MQYTSARRLAGLAYAGSLATLATILFVYQMPSTLFPHRAGALGLDALALGIWYLMFAAVSFPFDVWAGHWAPCRYGGVCGLFPVYLGRLTRGLAAQALVMVGTATAMLSAGRVWGVWGASGVLAASMGLLALARGWFGRYLGAERVAGVGRAWVALAYGWNLAGFALVALLPWCSVETVYGLVETLLGFALWTLLGMAVLGRARGVMLYLSWAGFGLLGRATAARAGRPEHWVD